MCKVIDTRGFGLDEFLRDNDGYWDIPDMSPPRSKPRNKKPSRPVPSQSLSLRASRKVCQVQAGKPATIVKL